MFISSVVMGRILPLKILAKKFEDTTYRCLLYTVNYGRENIHVALIATVGVTTRLIGLYTLKLFVTFPKPQLNANNRGHISRSESSESVYSNIPIDTK